MSSAINIALIELVLFLEASDDKIVDPDAAVDALESVAAVLSEASPDEKLGLVSQIREMSEGHPHRSELLGLIEGLGLLD